MTAEQGTFEWYRERWGKVTMSVRVGTIMSGTVPQLNKLLEKIRWERAQPEHVVRAQWEEDRQTSEQVESLRWGNVHEQKAADLYAMTRCTALTRAPFRPHPAWPDLCGTSADYLERLDGQPVDVRQVGPGYRTVELKCPSMQENHYRAIQHGMDLKYYDQCQGHMECWGVSQCVWASYFPVMQRDEWKLVTEVVDADPEWQERFSARMGEFASKVVGGGQFDFEMGKFVDGLPTIF